MISTVSMLNGFRTVLRYFQWTWHVL